MLLSDPKIAAYLNENFVCAWESVAPVPQVSIDFGNGKRLRRTLGGNTVLYVVAPDGKVADAFPGLYMPEQFLPQLLDSMRAYRAGDLAFESLRAFHSERTDLPFGINPVTVMKSGVESPLLRATRLKSRYNVPDETTAYSRAFLDASRRLADWSKSPGTVGQLATGLGLPPGATPAERGRQLLQLDSQLSVNSLRPVTHLFFAGRTSLPTVAEAKDALFTHVLHLDLKDPYLGLADADVPGTPTLRTP